MLVNAVQAYRQFLGNAMHHKIVFIYNLCEFEYVRIIKFSKHKITS
jgi:hypothetical protein